MTSTLLDQAHNAIERQLFAMKGFHHPKGSPPAFSHGAGPPVQPGALPASRPARRTVWGGRWKEATVPTRRLVPQPPDSHLWGLALSGDTRHTKSDGMWKKDRASRDELLAFLILCWANARTTVFRDRSQGIGHAEFVRYGTTGLASAPIERRRQTGASTMRLSEGRAAQLLEEGEFLHNVGDPRSAARAGDGGILKVQRTVIGLPELTSKFALETIIGGVRESGVAKSPLVSLAKKPLFDETCGKRGCRRNGNSRERRTKEQVERRRRSEIDDAAPGSKWKLRRRKIGIVVDDGPPRLTPLQDTDCPRRPQRQCRGLVNDYPDFSPPEVPTYCQGGIIDFTTPPPFDLSLVPSFPAISIPRQPRFPQRFRSTTASSLMNQLAIAYAALPYPTNNCSRATST